MAPIIVFQSGITPNKNISNKYPHIILVPKAILQLNEFVNLNALNIVSLAANKNNAIKTQ